MILNTKDDVYNLRFALDNVPAYVYMKDNESKYLYANEPTLKFFDCTSETIVGKSDKDFFSEAIAENLLKTDLEVLSGKSTTNEVIIHDDKEEQIVYLEKKMPILYKGEKNKDIVGILGILTDITKSKSLENEIQEASMLDSLTGAYNRQFIIGEIEKSMKRSTRVYNNCSILHMRLSNLKQTNDKYGHKVGDALLIEVVKRINDSVRESDTCARIGGDNFLVLLENLSVVNAQAKQESESIIKKIQTTFAKGFTFDGKKYKIEASLGFAIYSGDKLSFEEILQKASSNIYEEL
jgi:diguanylate cyclase (GGDEF)-like protein